MKYIGVFQDGIGNQVPIICTVRNDSTLKPTQYRIINDTQCF